jgi:dTDP-4-amino-4,6-dideoxygalactose transaminase
MAMDKLIQIAKNYNLYLIEDAAQAHGASRDGIMAGNFADGSIFSFYPTKNLGAIGDGGMICSNSVLLIDWMKKFRNFGSTIKYEHEIIGCNSRLDELQAYFLNIKIETLDVENNKRRDIARFYLENLDGNIYKLPPSDNIDGDAWHLFVIRHKKP